MQLGDVLQSVSLDVATSCVEITSVEIDSRACSPGALFFAMSGTHGHGAQFVDDAVRNGAVAVVTDTPISALVPVVVVPTQQLHELMTNASSVVVGRPENRVELVGVTGTNGKTSVTSLVSSLVSALGWNAASIGTLTNERTTPAPPELFRTLAELDAGFDRGRTRSVVAMEVSSHALDQHRVEGLHFSVTAFTNLSHDHLDYHHSMEEYFNAKAQLFTSDHAERAVIWCDDSYGLRLADMTTIPASRVYRSDASDVSESLQGTIFFWRGHLVNTPLIGDYNVDNALMAMEIVRSLGAEEEHIAHAMSDVRGVPGRFELVSGRDVMVIVDYAHTPAGLTRLLSDVRRVLDGGRVITVFGCGGDRDRAKRPAMGEVASSASEITIVTSDNPRSESPDAIIDSVIKGVTPGAMVLRMSDRRAAIAEAIRLAQPGDAVVIAGKGHETTQIIGDLVVPFDDREVAREFLK
ncbi:MAG: UDP-N-acetylmuramoyl-L-alanyl-D-glutamate--2,6-diaminopimelate ligase [Acidimicrobiales bacterium]